MYRCTHVTYRVENRFVTESQGGRHLNVMPFWLKYVADLKFFRVICRPLPV